MKLRSKVAVTACTGSIALGALVICGMTRVRADGIPPIGALTYSGALEDVNGAPASGTKAIKVALFDAESGGVERCSVTKTVTLTNGRFSILLPDTCAQATRETPGLWAEIVADGDSLGRTKLGAVPFAVEAERATQASGALRQQIVPPGAVMAFALPACPPGWSAFADASGRVVIGTGQGIALNAKVGNDAVTLSAAQLPPHSHGVTDPGHAHAVANTINYNIAPTFALGGQGVGQATINSGASVTNIQIQNSGGGQPFDNRQASVALLYCKKD
jgi:hypothetical protein